MPNIQTQKLTVIWCPNCGRLRINHLAYYQCPICGAAVEIEENNKSFKKDAAKDRRTS